jgi:hypothetical protein
MDVETKLCGDDGGARLCSFSGRAGDHFTGWAEVSGLEQAAADLNRMDEPNKLSKVEGIKEPIAQVGANGAVRGVQLVRYSNPLVGPLAEQALQRWKMQERMIGGESVPYEETVDFAFWYRDGKTKSSIVRAQ